MPRFPWVLRAAAVAWLVAGAGAARAQMPVCPEEVPQGRVLVYRSCGAGGTLAIARFLQEITIDHAARANDQPFHRSLADAIAMAYDARKLRDTPLDAYLRGLPPLELTRLDASTGNVDWAIDEQSRTFTLRGFQDLDPTRFAVTIDWPPRVRGGYWRTPATFQVALWEKARPKLRVTAIEGFVHEVEISCIVVTANRIRIETGDGSKPDILIVFDECL